MTDYCKMDNDRLCDLVCKGCTVTLSGSELILMLRSISYFLNDAYETKVNKEIKEHIAHLAESLEGKILKAVKTSPNTSVMETIDLDTPIVDCSLKPRTVNVCLINGISTVRNLTQMTSADLVKLQRFGKSSMREILNFLHRYGLSLKGI